MHFSEKACSHIFEMLTLLPISYLIYFFIHLKLCLVSATHTFYGSENYSFLFNLRLNTTMQMFKHPFYPQYECFDRLIKTIVVVVSGKGVNMLMCVWKKDNRDLKGVVNCQNSLGKGPPEGNSARG